MTGKLNAFSRLCVFQDGDTLIGVKGAAEYEARHSRKGVSYEKSIISERTINYIRLQILAEEFHMKNIPYVLECERWSIE